MYKKVFLFISFFVIALPIYSNTANNLPLNSQQSRIVKSISSFTTKLNGYDPNIQDDSDLENLDDIIDGATIIGLGEGTHGTHEYSLMKHRILQYLVEKKGYTIFAMEASMPHVERINEYVLNGTGDPRKLLEEIGFLWVYITHEVLDMIEWVRQYNLTADHKIQFMGFDMQGPTNISVKIITDYLIRVGKLNDVITLNQIVNDIKPLNKIYIKWYHVWDQEYIHELMIQDRYQKLFDELKQKILTPDEYNKEAAALQLKLNEALKDNTLKYSYKLETIKNQAMLMGKQLDKRIDDFAHEVQNQPNQLNQDNRELAWIIQNIRLIKQLIEMEGFLIDRDRCMADNVQWIMDQNSGSKIILWAHSGHIGYFHDSDGNSMGQYLQNKLGDQYRTIGFLTYQGQYHAASGLYNNASINTYELQTPPDNAFESYLDKLNIPNLLLNFWNKDQIPDLLKQSIITRCLIGSIKYDESIQFTCPPENLPQEYDGMIYLKSTTASWQLNQKT